MLLWYFVYVVPVLVALAWYVKYLFSYWERKGFPSHPSDIPFGCLRSVVRQKQSVGDLITNIYLRSKEPFLGLFLLFRPALMINDAALVKRVLVTDFDHFTDRGVHYDPDNDPFAANLFTMPGQEWRDLRTKLSPTFTSGKLKNMFYPIEEKTALMRNHLMKATGKNQGPVQLKKILIQLNLSIIATVFFGFELNAFEHPDHEFNKMGDMFFDLGPLRNKIVNVGIFLCPSVLKILKIPTLTPLVTKYIGNLVKTVVDARKADPSLVRKDFIQTIIELMQNQGEHEKGKLTVQRAAAQAFLFYTAGYETSAATTSFCMYELSKSPVWMGKVREEVDAMMERTQGNVTYEDLLGLKVLDMCIKEAMRMYAAVPILNRECTKEYRIPGTDKVIPKGTAIIIPVLGLHLDPKHYSDPNTFDPSRFEGDKEKDDHPYYPLGGGPRYCVGARLGFMMIRRALCTLVHDFTFEAVDQKLEFNPGAVLLSDMNHILMNIEKRDKGTKTT